MKEKTPDSWFVQDKNVKIYAGSRAGPFNITDLSEICDFSDVVLDLCKGLELNYFELHMPLASELISNATAAPASHLTVMKPNAFERLIAESSAQNKTVVLAKNLPTDNKDRLFNECAKYIC